MIISSIITAILPWGVALLDWLIYIFFLVFAENEEAKRKRLAEDKLEEEPLPKRAHQDNDMDVKDG
jgi:hypothetical protein